MSDFILYPDPRLSQKADPRPVDEALRAIGADLLDAARKAQAYGLAAAHIGQVAPLIVVNMQPEGARDDRVFFNPDVLDPAGDVAEGQEGSVSMPGIQVMVPRAVSARIAYDDETGAHRTLDVEGFLARVFLHEIDQVNGVWFLNRVSRLKRDRAIKKFLKLQRD